MTRVSRRLAGLGCAAVFNARAKQVTPKAVRAFERLVPGALVRVSEDLAQLRRQVEELLPHAPEVVFCGGGDGAATQLYAELCRVFDEPPVLGLLPLGTGNAWARSTGARSFALSLASIAQHRGPWEYRRQPLVELEGVAAPFAGLGWGAQLLTDYQTELDHQSAALLTGRLRRRLLLGLPGYLLSAGRRTIPRGVLESLDGRAQVTVTSLDDRALVAGPDGRHHREGGVIYRGAPGVVGFSTICQYGFGLRAFPLAPTEPDRVNVRAFDGHVLSAVRHVVKLWEGTTEVEGLHDCFVARARISCSHPLAFQIAGDPKGMREAVEIAIAPRLARVLDWRAVELARLHRRSDDR